MSGLLRFASVTCVRGGRVLFEGLDLDLASGGALHVAGPNGSGKSSLLRLAAGLLLPAGGRVDRPATAALADEHLALDRELPLARALAFWNGGRAPIEAMAAMGISDLAAIPVRLLSTGEARRARLARVIAARAQLWLLDEPFNGLDQDGSRQLREAVSNHLSSGGAVLAASHQPLGDGWARLELAR